MNQTVENTFRKVEPPLRGLGLRLSALIRLFRENPVMMKDMRSRMRNGRTFGVLLAYQALLGLILFFLWVSYVQFTQPRAMSYLSPQEVGQLIFRTLFVTQAVLIALAVLTTTSGSITLECEHRSYEMLASTNLTPREIVFGKLMAIVLYAALLLTSSLPLASITFMLGGVSPSELLMSYVLLIITSITYAAFGVGVSAISKRTAAATSVSVAALGLYMLFTLPMAAAGGDWFIQTINPIGSIVHPMSSWPFYTKMVPAWIPAIILNLLGAALLALQASNSLPLYRTRSVLALRVIWAIFFVILTLCFTANIWGDWIGQAASPTLSNIEDLTSSCIAFIASILMMTIPAFCTAQRDEVPGDPERIPSKYRWWCSLNGAPFYLLALFGIGVILAWISLPISGISAAKIPLRWWAATLITCVTVLMSMGGIAVWFSRIMPRRNAAAGWNFVLMVALLLAPLLSLIDYDVVLTPQRPLVQNALYLSPLFAISDATDPASFYRDFPQFSHAPVPAWLVTSAIYAVIGLASVLLIRISGKKASRNDK